jgi:hypothetical protein
MGNRWQRNRNDTSICLWVDSKSLCTKKSVTITECMAHMQWMKRATLLVQVHLNAKSNAHTISSCRGTIVDKRWLTFPHFLSFDIYLFSKYTYERLMTYDTYCNTCISFDCCSSANRECKYWGRVTKICVCNYWDMF